jgi:hypothetical protein
MCAFLTIFTECWTLCGKRIAEIDVNSIYSKKWTAFLCEATMWKVYTIYSVVEVGLELCVARVVFSAAMNLNYSSGQLHHFLPVAVCL